METISIPKIYVYEEVDGKPIYYKNYKSALKQNKEGDIMGSSGLQSAIIFAVLEFLILKGFSKKYKIFSNEVGLQIGKGNTRSADIAIYEKKDAKSLQIDDKYLNKSPKVVLEVDIKADTENFASPLDYYFKKTKELLQFGVEKVVWITTNSEMVMIAESNKPWIHIDWDVDFEVLPNCKLNIAKLVANI